MRDGWTKYNRDSLTYVSKNGRYYSLDEAYTFGSKERCTSGEIVCFERIVMPNTTEEELLEIEKECGTRYTWRGNFVSWCAGNDESEYEIDEVCEYMEKEIEKYELNN